MLSLCVQISSNNRSIVQLHGDDRLYNRPRTKNEEIVLSRILAYAFAALNFRLRPVNIQVCYSLCSTDQCAKAYVCSIWSLTETDTAVTAR